MQIAVIAVNQLPPGVKLFQAQLKKLTNEKNRGEHSCSVLFSLRFSRAAPQLIDH